MADGPDPTRSKVGRLIDRYGTAGLGQELEDRWLGRGYEEQSLRSLADWFNRRLLGRRLAEAGHDPIDGEVSNLYRLRSEDDITAWSRVDAEATLEEYGVDTETVRREFVSHQAVHTYLTEFRAASKERSATDRGENVRGTIQRLRSRLVAVAENSLDNLRTAGDLTIGEFTVLLEVQVLCEDCGASYPITDRIRRGQCECAVDTES
jgi:hypothetical protein